MPNHPIHVSLLSLAACNIVEAAAQHIRIVGASSAALWLWLLTLRRVSVEAKICQEISDQCLEFVQ